MDQSWGSWKEEGGLWWKETGRNTSPCLYKQVWVWDEAFYYYAMYHCNRDKCIFQKGHNGCLIELSVLVLAEYFLWKYFIINLLQIFANFAPTRAALYEIFCVPWETRQVRFHAFQWPAFTCVQTKPSRIFVFLYFIAFYQTLVRNN